MPITQPDIKTYLSGGVTNTNPAASLGGVRSGSGQVIDNTAANLFPNAPGSETLAGSTSFLCCYVRNEHPTITFENIRFYVSKPTDSDEDEIDIAIGSVAKNATEITIANITTQPGGGITFSHPTNYATGLVIPNLSPNDYFPIWFRRTIQANLLQAVNDNTFRFNVDGDTSA
jgi:hypothetical protein